MLSDIAREQLTRIGIQKNTFVARCSACLKSASDMDPKKPHPVEAEWQRVNAEYFKAQQKSIYKKNKLADPVVRPLYQQKILLESKLTKTSRCCGEKFKYEMVDYHQFVYDRWQEAKRTDMEAIMKVPQAGVTPEDMINGRFQGRPLISQDFRSRLPESFVRLQHILNCSDLLVNEILVVFVEEDQRDEGSMSLRDNSYNVAQL